MKYARIAFVVFLLIAVVVLAVILVVQWAIRGNGEDGATPVAGTPLPTGAVVVEIHSSNTKQDWMDQVVASFNAAGYTVNDKPIVVTVAHVGSGSSMNNILFDKRLLRRIASIRNYSRSPLRLPPMRQPDAKAARAVVPGLVVPYESTFDRRLCTRSGNLPRFLGGASRTNDKDSCGAQPPHNKAC